MRSIAFLACFSGIAFATKGGNARSAKLDEGSVLSLFIPSGKWHHLHGSVPLVVCLDVKKDSPLAGRALERWPGSLSGVCPPLSPEGVDDEELLSAKEGDVSAEIAFSAKVVSPPYGNQSGMSEYPREAIGPGVSLHLTYLSLQHLGAGPVKVQALLKFGDKNVLTSQVVVIDLDGSED